MSKIDTFVVIWFRYHACVTSESSKTTDDHQRGSWWVHERATPRRCTKCAHYVPRGPPKRPNKQLSMEATKCTQNTTSVQVHVPLQIPIWLGWWNQHWKCIFRGLSSGILTATIRLEYNSYYWQRYVYQSLSRVPTLRGI